MQDKKKITDNKILKNEITLLKIQITWDTQALPITSIVVSLIKASPLSLFWFFLFIAEF